MLSAEGEGESQRDEKPCIASYFLECAICLNLICEPITLSCGHSFCRICLVKTLTRNKKKCPSCRAVCHNCAEDQPENVMLSQIARAAFPEVYSERLLELNEEKSLLKAIHPIFYYNLPMFPGEILSLHLFEPRYKLMMKRIIDTTRRFVYVPNYTNYIASQGDVALIAEIRDCHFQSDGRCTLHAHLIGRRIILDHFVEDGTHGLHYCQLGPYEDDPMTEEEIVIATLISKPLMDVVKAVLEPISAEVTKKHGDMPPHTQSQLFSLYIAGVLPYEKSQKHNLLTIRNTLERLTACSRIMLSMGNNVPHREALVSALSGRSGQQEDSSSSDEES